MGADMPPAAMPMHLHQLLVWSALICCRPTSDKYKTLWGQRREQAREQEQQTKLFVEVATIKYCICKVVFKLVCCIFACMAWAKHWDQTGIVHQILIRFCVGVSTLKQQEAQNKGVRHEHKSCTPLPAAADLCPNLSCAQISSVKGWPHWISPWSRGVGWLLPMTTAMPQDTGSAGMTLILMVSSTEGAVLFEPMKRIQDIMGSARVSAT